jgi:biopolymer transport protein ExbB/TolQ
MCLIKRISAVIVSIVLALLICLAVYLLGPGNRIFEMIFHRGPVQFFTLYAFALIITLLSHRLIVYICEKIQLNRVEEGKYGWQNNESIFSKHLHSIRKLLSQNNTKAASLCVENFAQQRKDNINKAYELIHFLMGSLPAFGLLGTVLGLSGAMFRAFSNGQVGPDSIKLFTSALGTALDTTVLALVCSLPAGMLIWLLSRREIELSERETKFVHYLFPLQTPSVSRTENPESVSFPIKDFKKEMQSLIAQIVAETISKSCEGVGKAVDEILSRQQAHEETAVQKIAENLNKSVERMNSIIIKNNNNIVSGLNYIINSFDKRIPNELVIRYNRSKEMQKETSCVA